jgi:hypothetical protein
MAIQIITNPEILVQLSVPSESVLVDNFALTLNAIRNATIFEFQRKDVSVYNVTNIGGFCRVNFIDEQIIANGLSIYLSSGVYASSGTITATSSYYIDTDIVYSTATSGGYLNISNKKNYEVEVRLYYGYKSFTLYPHTIIGVPDTMGNCFVDVSTGLRYICNKGNNINYDYEATQDLLNSGLFYIQYREVWKDYEGSWLTASSYWQYLYAVLQPPRAIYNNIMELYEMSFSRETKFLSAFEKPKYFNGYPFSVSYFNHYLYINSTLQLNKVLKYKNINKVVRDTDTTPLPNTNNFGLMHTIIQDISCDDSYVTIQLTITANDCEVNCYVEPNYVECDYVACGYGTKEDSIGYVPPPIFPPAIPT